MPPEAARGTMNAMNEVFIIPHNVRLGGDLITKAQGDLKVLEEEKKRAIPCYNEQTL